MKGLQIYFLFFFTGVVFIVNAQSIAYSTIDKADNKNIKFEILGRFSQNIIVYKNVNRNHKLAVYNNTMQLIETIKLDYVSDNTSNIDFVKYADSAIMVWQYERGNTTFCKAAKINGAGKLMGQVYFLDSTKVNFFGNKVFYTLTWSEDKSKVLLYKTFSRGDAYTLVTKLYNDNLVLQDSTRRSFDFNNNRESFTDLQVANNGNFIFCKLKENARQEYLNGLQVHIKKYKVDTTTVVEIPLKDRLIQEPAIKIDNLNANYLLSTFIYKKNRGTIEGLFNATISDNLISLTQQTITVFADSLIAQLSGKPNWNSAFDNFILKNIILKKDGGFVLMAEEFTKVRRFGGSFDNRFNNGGFFGNANDFYLFNRGFNGYYRSFDDMNGRDITYNYNDVIIAGFSKNLEMLYSNVINKTTSDVETDNFLSFSNMIGGGEINFVFLQKDNNRQVLSRHALQTNGTMIRYATLKSREAGYEFMPRLARQTGLKQMIVPCITKNSIAFAKIDF